MRIYLGRYICVINIWEGGISEAQAVLGSGKVDGGGGYKKRSPTTLTGPLQVEGIRIRLKLTTESSPYVKNRNSDVRAYASHQSHLRVTCLVNLV